MLQNLEFNLETKLKIDDNEISIIPIGKGFFNDNNSKYEVFNFLVKFINKKNNISSGNIYQYHKSSNIKTIEAAQSELTNLLEKKGKLKDGKITILDITDVYLSDIFIKENKIENIRYLESKKQENASKGVSCIDWYYVVYNLQTGDIISIIYLYTTCNCEQTRTNPENDKSTHSNKCGAGGGGGNPAYSEEDLQNYLLLLTGGGYSSEVTIFNHTLFNGANSNYNFNEDVSFGCGKSTYWSVTGLARFTENVNYGNINLNLISVNVNCQTSFPAWADLIYDGIYTPTGSPTDVILNNNSTQPYTEIIRNGEFKVKCVIPQFSWLEVGGTIFGKLNFKVTNS